MTSVTLGTEITSTGFLQTEVKQQVKRQAECLEALVILYGKIHTYAQNYVCMYV
jgi:hypothetical protein